MEQNTTKKYLSIIVTEDNAKIALFGFFGVIFGILFALSIEAYLGALSQPTVVEKTTPERNVLPESEPVGMRIPSVGIDAVFEDPLGVQDTGEIEVPDSYETLGWYKHGPTPGEIGPSVVLGHVDSYEGPAVLFNLKEVNVGESIEIDRADGSTVVFEIQKIEKHTQQGFPTEKVYNDLDYSGLRLITCTGTFNRGIQQYSHNLIVFAELVTDEGNVEAGNW